MGGNRFFRTTPEVYESTRQALDAIYGHPNGRAETCLPPEPLMTGDGDVVVAILSVMTERPEVSSQISELLGSGDATEITREDYEASIPKGNGNGE